MHSGARAASQRVPSSGTRGTGVVARFYRPTTLRLRPRQDGFRWLIAVVIALFALAAHAKEAIPESPDPTLEARMVRVTSELRCLVCQNQTIADSHADLAVDLRAQVREQLKAGRSDEQIIDYMTARYGDFVLYRPPFKATTALLWLGPALMLAIGLVALAIVLRRRSRLAADAFEADEDELDDVAPSGAPARGPQRNIEHA